MNRKTLTRLAFASVAAPALAFGAPATALADSFFEAEASWAGFEGAGSKSVTAFASDGGDRHHHKGGDDWDDDNGHHGGWDGGSFYEKEATWAGHDGAASHSITSAAD